MRKGEPGLRKEVKRIEQVVGTGSAKVLRSE